MLPAHFALLAALAVAPALLLALLPLRRAAVAGAVLGLLGLAALVAVDLRVFALYRFHLDGMVARLLVSGVADEILPLSRASWLAAAARLAGLAAGEVLLAAATWWLVRRQPRLHGGKVGAALALLVACAAGLHAWADAHRESSVTRQVRYLPWLRWLTASSLLDRLGLLPQPPGPGPALPAAGSGLRYPREALRCEPPAPPRSVLLLVIEGWRFDVLDPETTPRLWELAHTSARFARHSSSGNSTRTGIFGLLYGLHGSYWDAMLVEERGPALFHEALRAGYHLEVRTSASPLHPEFDRTAFVELRDRLPLHTPGEGAWERDRFVTDSLLRFLDGASEPFLGFLFYDAPHSFDFPEAPPPPFQPSARSVDHLALGPGFDPAPLFNRYRNSLHAVDALAGEVLDALAARGLLERTVVVATGDHGEEFDELGQNYWGHNGNFARYQTRVPLLVRWPGHPARDYDHLTSHADVAPTLLRGVFGCRAPASAHSNGRDLFDTSPRRYVVASNDRGVAILERERITLVERYGGATVYDPELRELALAPDPVLLRELARSLSAFYAR